MHNAHLIAKVEKFARERHAGLSRRNKENQPIIEHLWQVAELTRSAGGAAEAIAAGWLHDSVEDTNTTHSEIRCVFGPDVGRMVFLLTDPPAFEGMELVARKKLQAARLAGFRRAGNEIEQQAFLPKVSDQLSNNEIVLIDPPLHFNADLSLAYVWGALQVVNACRGTDSKLEALFDDVSNRAIAKYRPQASTQLVNKLFG